MPVSGKAGAFGKAGEWAASVVLTMIGHWWSRVDRTEWTLTDYETPS